MKMLSPNQLNSLNFSGGPGALPETVLEQERQQLARFGRRLHLGVLGELHFRFALDLALELFVVGEHVHEALVFDADRFGRHGRFGRDRAREHAGLLADENLMLMFATSARTRSS